MYVSVCVYVSMYVRVCAVYTIRTKHTHLASCYLMQSVLYLWSGFICAVHYRSCPFKLPVFDAAPIHVTAVLASLIVLIRVLFTLRCCAPVISRSELKPRPAYRLAVAIGVCLCSSFRSFQTNASQFMHNVIVCLFNPYLVNK
jgi:hypothetical protein